MFDKTRQNLNKVKDAILGYIKANNLKPGERCSSELYFSNELKINRRTVRMAIEKLCEEGILRKEPDRGIFLVQLPDLPESENESIPTDTCGLFPMGSCFLQRNEPETLIFGLDDSKIHNWEMIFSEFEKHVGYKIRVIPRYLIKYNDVSSKKIPACDIYLISIRNIRIDGIELNNRPAFPKGWFTANPMISSFSPALKNNIIRCSLNGGEAPSIVPVGFSIPFQLVNRAALHTHSLPEPPSFPSLGQFSDWITALGNKRNDKIFPFIQNSLQHFCRMRKTVIADEKNGKVKIDFPECRDLLTLQKQYFKKFLLEREEFVFPALQNALKTGDFILIEFFSNAMSYIKSFYPDSASRFTSVADCFNEADGISQVVMRFLMMGENCRNPKGSIAFASFMASPEGQALLAEQKSIFPCCHSDENLGKFCHGTPLKEEIVFRELGNASGFFDSRFFAAEFEERVLNPIMRLYFNDAISLDETIEKIEASDFIAKNAPIH